MKRQTSFPHDDKLQLTAETSKSTMRRYTPTNPERTRNREKNYLYIAERVKEKWQEFENEAEHQNNNTLRHF
jgi:hypothetical protein